MSKVYVDPVIQDLVQRDAFLSLRSIRDENQDESANLKEMGALFGLEYEEEED